MNNVSLAPFCNHPLFRDQGTNQSHLFVFHLGFLMFILIQIHQRFQRRRFQKRAGTSPRREGLTLRDRASGRYLPSPVSDGAATCADITEEE